MERYGLVVEIKSSQIEEYERIHADVWPGVLATIAACNVHNYSIYRYNNLLFTYYEYHGSDWAADMAGVVRNQNRSCRQGMSSDHHVHMSDEIPAFLQMKSNVGPIVGGRRIP